MANTCCFIGHRTIVETEELETQLRDTIERLILTEGVNTFLFGSGSKFDSLCRAIVTDLKQTYKAIQRIYVRAEYCYINDHYENYLLESYEGTYYPQQMIRAGRASYVERNAEMIRQSQFCIFYYNESCLPVTRKSGTKIALAEARKRGKNIFLFSATGLLSTP